MKIQQIKLHSLLLLFVVLICSACGDDDNPTNTNCEDTKEYMGINHTWHFKGTGTNMLYPDLPAAIVNWDRIFTSNDGDKYEYQVIEIDDEPNTSANGTMYLSCSQILCEYDIFKMAGYKIGNDIASIPLKLPIFDINNSSEQVTLDTIVKQKVNLKEIFGIDITINVDIKVKATLKGLGNKNITVGSETFDAKSFITSINFTLVTNDPLLAAMGFNNKTMGTLEFTETNSFTNKNNLGIIGQAITCKLTNIDIDNIDNTETIKENYQSTSELLSYE